MEDNVQLAPDQLAMAAENENVTLADGSIRERRPFEVGREMTTVADVVLLERSHGRVISRDALVERRVVLVAGKGRGRGE